MPPFPERESSILAKLKKKRPGAKEAPEHKEPRPVAQIATSMENSATLAAQVIKQTKKIRKFRVQRVRYLYCMILLYLGCPCCPSACSSLCRPSGAVHACPGSSAFWWWPP